MRAQKSRAANAALRRSKTSAKTVSGHPDDRNTPATNVDTAVEQTALFEVSIDPVTDVDDERDERTAEEKFLDFHDQNPAVYQAYVRLSRMWLAQTHGRKIGIGALTERVRWELSFATAGDEFKINNNYRSWYARLLMSQEPDLAELFELRRSAADARDWSAAA